jgi:hypothetical protein
VVCIHWAPGRCGNQLQDFGSLFRLWPRDSRAPPLTNYRVGVQLLFSRPSHPTVKNESFHSECHLETVSADMGPFCSENLEVVNFPRARRLNELGCCKVLLGFAINGSLNVQYSA